MIKLLDVIMVLTFILLLIIGPLFLPRLPKEDNSPGIHDIVETKNTLIVLFWVMGVLMCGIYFLVRVGAFDNAFDPGDQ